MSKNQKYNRNGEHTTTHISKCGNRKTEMREEEQTNVKGKTIGRRRGGERKIWTWKRKNNDDKSVINSLILNNYNLIESILDFNSSTNSYYVNWDKDILNIVIDIKKQIINNSINLMNNHNDSPS